MFKNKSKSRPRLDVERLKNAEVRTKYNDCMRKKSIKRRMEISRKFGNYKISLCKLSGGNPKLQKRKRALDQRRHVKANRWKKGN